jgi:hypothetical protein
MVCILVTTSVVNKLLSVLTGVKTKIKLLSRMMFVLLANVAAVRSNDFLKATLA